MTPDPGLSSVRELVRAGGPALAARVSDRLELVEMHLREAVSDGFPMLREAAGHLLEAGGKRMRPLLVLLGAEFGDPGAPSVIPAAASVELVHVASLYHDDVMDEAPLRHGVPSAHVKWDTKVAILVGDYLFARAAGLELPEQARVEQARCVAHLVAGQVRESAGPAPGDDRLDHYLQVLQEKSASLIRFSARLGGLCAGAPPHVTAALAEYGELLGMAFQLSDDLIDVLSEPDESGKGAGTDLRAGVLTLPALHALALSGADLRTGRAEAGRLAELLAMGPLTDPALHAEALTLLRRSPAMLTARAEVERYAAEAAAVARALPANPARDVLLALSRQVVHRTI
ncbi:polyprenyl synthetase family protein [Nonomuraea sp. NPDC050663]|uniref:polyprenyl synthetase family protein n=1 Tax=Nonomuraea sp. NPDC050663 TaxID=3364370 RepID=UPI003797DAEE